jgi:hypothetical protein
VSIRDGDHRRVQVAPDPARRRVIVTCSCGQSYAVPVPSTTTMNDWLQQAQHAHATRSPRACVAGCHVGDLADFEHYLDVHGVPDDRAGEAFADYLTLQYGWDGQSQRVDLHIAE